jgi:hypothetical protein
MMTQRSYRKILLAGLAAGFLALQAFFAAQASVQTSGSGVVLLQETAYPADETEVIDGLYPAESPTPRVGGGGGPTPTPFIIVLETPTPIPSVTAGPELARTEDAEILDSLASPVASASPWPSITPVNTLTAEVQLSPTVPVEIDKKAGFYLDWGFFWVGFAIPVLAGCGAVLYLLDRRPDLFRRRPRA